jgi:cytochrome c
MKNLESNKIIASILLAGLIAMLCGFFTNLFYHPKTNLEKRGYEVTVIDNSAAGQEQEEQKEIVISDLMKIASYEKGKTLSKKCAACHSFEKDGPNKVGPNLWNILGANIASKPGYSYSKALESIEGNWGYDSMYHFLNNPKKYAPGTKMSFIGLKKPDDVAAMIEFLRNNSDTPLPLPN